MGNEIIINGVNVAGCEHHLSTGYCQLQMIFKGMVLKLPFGKHLECNLCDKDCYYKQLQRLKEAYNDISNNSEILHENHSLRIANAKLSEDLWQHGISMREWREQSLNYRSALEEINLILDELKQQYDYMADYSEIKEIKEKIDEVLK